MNNTLQEQYNLIKEGKGNKDYFLKQALRQFPNLITPALGFDNTITILTQKQIISENIINEEPTNWISVFKENITEAINQPDYNFYVYSVKQNKLLSGFEYQDDAQDMTNKMPSELGELKVYSKRKLMSLGLDPNQDESWGTDKVDDEELSEVKINDPVKAAEKALDDKEESLTETIDIDGNIVKTYTQNGDKSYNVTFDNGIKDIIYVSNDNWDKINQLHKNATGSVSISEAKEIKAKLSKTDPDVVKKETQGYDYKDKSKESVDNLYGQEFLMGYYCEMKDPKNTEKSVDELKKIVAKNLSSDSQFYVKKGQFGVKGLGYTDEAPGLGKTKEVKGKYKSSGMEPVKIKENKKLEESINYLIKEGLDLKEIETVAETAALEAKMAKVEKEKGKREKKIKALETLSEMDKDVVSKEGLNTLKKEIKLLEKMKSDIEKKMNKLSGVKKVVVQAPEEEELPPANEKLGDYSAAEV